MNDNADTIKTLTALREQHRKRLDANKDFRAWIALDRTIQELSGGYSNPDDARLGAGVRTGKTVSKEGKKLSQAAAVRQVILARGTPVTTRDLLTAIEKLGAKVGGKNPAGNLVSVLSSSKDFHSSNWNGERGWWLTDRALPSERKGEFAWNRFPT